jgi:predicted N-acetyltransferase YhbS
MTRISLLSAPELLSPQHTINDFESGEPSLDNWLKQRALKNQSSGASRCFVCCEQHTVVGYYSLSAGAIGHQETPKNLRRNMPDPLPVLLLGRLAVDQKYHNQGLGSALLRDAMLRAIHIANEMGIFAILVHALSNKAKQFYLSRGFIQSPLQEMTLMMTLETIRHVLIEKKA